MDFNQKQGFTLVELLVVISILGILGYVVMADYNGEIKRSRVRVAQETLYSELQDLRVRVTSGDYVVGEEVTEVDGTVDTEEILYCWGSFINLEEISRIFVEYGEDGCDYGNYEVDQELKLASGASVSEINDDALWGVFVFFDPPYGDMTIFDVNFTPLALEEEVKVTLGTAGYEKNILINPLTGNIQLDDPEEE